MTTLAWAVVVVAPFLICGAFIRAAIRRDPEYRALIDHYSGAED
jgi:hypothetical protein